MYRDLNDNQRQLRDIFSELGARHFTNETVKQWCSGQGLPDEVVRDFVDALFSFRHLRRENHFKFFDLTSRCIMLDELSYCSGSTLPFQHELFNLQLMEDFSGDDLFEQVLSDYHQSARVMFATAISDKGSGSDTMAMESSVETIDGKIILNGDKSYVFNGEYASSVLVAAIDRDNHEPSKYPHLSLWLVPSQLPGMAAFPIEKVGQAMIPLASMRFRNVELDSQWRLDVRKCTFQKLFRLLESGRLLICASCVGLARAAMHDAVREASRQRFGQPIHEFQQIGQMLTDMEVRLANMTHLLYRAAQAVDDDNPDRRLLVALAKRYIPMTATSVASDAMQILGGMGYTELSRTSRIWRDCRGNQIAEGTDQIMVRVATPLIVDKYQG
ncbi:acyl-CoA dehydrogenase [Berryella wangjianweii]|uniref:Acyl-CoA dehydrogenase n=1 Tax=Berryella wangjianweii TaxID=2734634 RepID=A0A6M8J8Q1_9ACTN|nr:acyl-CoA dehydrogenase family protein [Berryella wangjianweii]QKF07848.1 acyl-CoA dehydrogenase [Berryella wangjianweii]